MDTYLGCVHAGDRKIKGNKQDKTTDKVAGKTIDYDKRDLKFDG